VNFTDEPSAAPPARARKGTQAALARRATRQQLAAKRRGDIDLARLYARLAAEHVDRHLAPLRSRLP
jgi:hypothetical protein